jgi:hypothetical protein
VAGVAGFAFGLVAAAIWLHILGGIVGGATGLPGIVPTLWASVRGWTKDEQRAVFQPVAVAILVGCALWLGGTGTFDHETMRLFVLGLPALLLARSGFSQNRARPAPAGRLALIAPLVR